MRRNNFATLMNLNRKKRRSMENQPPSTDFHDKKDPAKKSRNSADNETRFHSKKAPAKIKQEEPYSAKQKQLKKKQEMTGFEQKSRKKQNQWKPDTPKQTFPKQALKQTPASSGTEKSSEKNTQTLQKKYTWIVDKKRIKSDPNACPLALKCGGCTYQGISYKKQLELKNKQVKKQVKQYVKVLPIIGMDDPYHYRNKVHAVFARSANGTIKSGIFQKGTHKVVNVDSCLIEDEIADKIIVDIRGLLKSFKIKIYDEDMQYGLLRHVLIRRGFKSGQVLVVLVLSSPILPSKNNFVKALCKLHPEITSIVININDKQTNMVLGERNITLYGKGYIEDELCGYTFRISPSSFYQVNPVQTELLYHTAMDYAGFRGTETVLDTYCGIGTIGLNAARHAKQVIGVDNNRDAIRDAISNAKINGIKNIYFYNQDADAFMSEFAQNNETIDIVFMDPPRNGCSEEFLNAVVELSPKRIVYISCNPETLARDMDYLVQHGYKGIKCQPIDMFPFSEHIECVVLMSRCHSND